MSVLTSTYTKQLHQYFGYQEVMGFFSTSHPFRTKIRFPSEPRFPRLGWFAPAFLCQWQRQGTSLSGWLYIQPSEAQKSRKHPLSQCNCLKKGVENVATHVWPYYGHDKWLPWGHQRRATMNLHWWRRRSFVALKAVHSSIPTCFCSVVTVQYQFSILLDVARGLWYVLALLGFRNGRAWSKGELPW